MRASPALSNFNGGELSPRLEGRVEYEKYQTGCSVMENAIPTVQGPSTARGGTRYVDEVTDAAYASWLTRFEFTYAQAFVLEWSHQKLAFFADRGRLLSSGAPYTIATPYTADDLVNADGGFALTLVQTGDVIYIAGGGRPQMKLSRLGNTNWTLAEFNPANGPFMDQNLVETLTIYASARTGSSVTLTASADVFTAAHVGALIRLEVQNPSAIPPWEPDKTMNVAELRRSDGKTYKCIAVSNKTGSIKPTHDKGIALDGSNGSARVTWEFQDAGYGVGRITAVTDSTHATVTVLSPFPEDVVSSGAATWRWMFGAWGTHNEYPTKVELYRDRLVWAGARTLYFSNAGDYENMSPDDVGQQTTETSITIRPSSSEANAVRWLRATDALLVGTAGAEFAVQPQTTSDPFGPDNVKAPLQSAYGGRELPAVRVGSSIMFVDKTGRRLREVRYDVDTAMYQAADLTVLASHVTYGGLVDLAWQQAPESILWAARADGTLVALTYEREQNVYAWHRHPLGGGGKVRSLTAIPAPDGTRDDLWLCVERQIGGQTRYVIERMEATYARDEGDRRDALYLDCGLSYSGPAATVISGLDHLEGETVTVIVDGATHPDRVVATGQITLQVPGTKVAVGYGYRARMRTMRIEGGSGEGTGQGKTKRITKAIVRLLDTLGGRIGPDWERMDAFQYRKGSTAMDAAPPLYSGDFTVAFPAGYESDGYVCLESTPGLPFTVALIVPIFQTQER